jgi:hypothetical protein
LADWTPAAMLPNLTAKKPIEGDVVAFAPHDDPRVQAFCVAHPQFKELISRFTDAFHVPLDPVVLIIRNDVLSELGQVEPLASFRDLVALSVIPYARSLAAVNGNRRRICYSNSFWLYPWMLGKDNVHIVASTPAMQAIHEVDQFHGQSSPELSPMVLTDADEPLFGALLQRWKRHYLGKRQRWVDRALFRSLNMANQAAQLPAGVDTTVFDLGRMTALWVSAFETLAHPRTANSGLRSVYPLFESVSYLDRNLGRCTYLAYMPNGKPRQRRPLPCWLYGELYQARCDFLHGNPIGPKALYPGGPGVSLFWLAPCLYQLALSAFMGLSHTRSTPKHNSPRKLAEAIRRQLRVTQYQRAIERALLRAQKRK